MAKSWAWGLAVVASVTRALVGCSTTSPMSSAGTVKAISAADMPMLTGTWQGTMSGATRNSFTATAVVNADGTYTLHGGPFHSVGRRAVRDGRLEFVATGGATGRAEPTMQDTERTASGVVMDEGSNWAVVGTGQSPTGPYNFAFRKPK